ncbi:uncharacterized protein F4807DRAFT_413761 [Annulohypoxylon truncatum]|uniref:uncharacterized protein n=1 Tax=Annulohypoxylon truncatum TaxID=327061 RepID=UPI0020075435|nr:uncharacterized protein F4807DRAFT_413761 [Annulohypoxylon truncatum]KAI1212617.1 hypothetical protein F4807DRAFT_413761 [Annulohypoxylon truncatum]
MDTMSTQSLNWTLINEMAAALTPEQRDQADWRIRNTGKLPMGDFQIAIGCLFGLASVAFFGRITIRVVSRRRVFLDDCFVIASFACLAVATAIFYKRVLMIYTVFALMRGDVVITLMASQEIDDVYAQMNWSFPYITFLWTTIFMVKLCYCAFFRILLQSMPKALIRYYWITVVATVVSWMYLVLQQLIVCPYFGSNSFKCFPTLAVSETVLNFTFWIGPVLDTLTDVAVVSIPILILRKSQMEMLTKIGLGVFLCLSLFMVACSITRAAGTYYNDTLDSPWQVFWLHTEACVSVLMASITVYRSILVNSSKFSSSFQKFLNRIIEKRESDKLVNSKTLTKKAQFGRFLLSKIPNATLTGLATMFGGPDHTQEVDNDMSMLNSTFDMRETDYHEHLGKPQPRPMPSVPSSRNMGESMGSREESWKASLASTRVANEQATEEQQRPRNRIAAFFLHILFPSSHRVILQHRSVETGQPSTDVS